MSPAQFRAWRKDRHWSQREAAEALGISASQIANYEAGTGRGERLGRPVVIPRAVALACAAIALGLRDYPR